MTDETQATINRYAATANALQLRLDTQPLLDNIEVFLRGGKIIVEQDKKGRIVSRRVTMGDPKANDLGIQSIINIVGSIINPQAVQGNFDVDQYDNFIYGFHINLATNIIANSPNWKIDDKDIDVIVDFIMPLVETFSSRLIDNKERESYSDTIKHIEGETKGGGFGMFKNA